MKVCTRLLSLLLLLLVVVVVVVVVVLLLLLLWSAVLKSCRLSKGSDPDTRVLPFGLTSLSYSYLWKPSPYSRMNLVSRAHCQEYEMAD